MASGRRVGGVVGDTLWGVNIIGFFVAIVLFVGGLLIMGYSFEPLPFVLPLGFEANSVLFFAGIMACSIGIAIPFHLMKRVDG